MCLILFSVNAHPDFPLVIAANRDEFYRRATTQVHTWENPAGLMAGRDEVGGGTWLGAHPATGIAMLTNYRDPGNIDPAAPSRGELVTGYFRNDAGPEAYLHEISKRASRYNGFNLICARPGEMFYFSNYGGRVARVADGLHGLSNGLLDDPWPKVTRGREMLESLHRRREKDPAAYLEMLLDETRAADDHLPQTGVTRELERVLSPMFITSPEYGSRSSSVILADHHGRVRFVERTYVPGSMDFNDKEFQFAWSNP